MGCLLVLSISANACDNYVVTLQCKAVSDPSEIGSFMVVERVPECKASRSVLSQSSAQPSVPSELSRFQAKHCAVRLLAIGVKLLRSIDARIERTGLSSMPGHVRVHSTPCLPKCRTTSAIASSRQPHSNREPLRTAPRWQGCGRKLPAYRWLPPCRHPNQVLSGDRPQPSYVLRAVSGTVVAAVLNSIAQVYS